MRYRPRKNPMDFELYTPNKSIEIPGGSAESAVSVASLNDTVKMLVEGGLAPLWVRGEVSDFKKHRNGHWYFTLKDATSQVRCVVWSRDQIGIPTSPDVGMEVSLFGRLTFYSARGDLHLTVTKIEARGDGLWQKALLESQQRLEKEGLLAPERKRALPYSPAVIAVVTSPDGAAFRDIYAVVKRRAPQVQLVISPAKVQGDGAANEIIIALKRVVDWGQAEVVIVGRGGGSKEDLWAFNSEDLARAIAACPIPVISAVGHEIDFSLSDLIADFRAPTPSAAGEAVVPVSADLGEMLRSYEGDLHSVMRRRLIDARYLLTTYSRSIKNNAKAMIDVHRSELKGIAGRMNALSPLATLSRGYAVARDPETGRTLTRVSDFKDGAEFDLTVSDGTIRAQPTTKRDPDVV